jgi:hypothetical protein
MERLQDEKQELDRKIGNMEAFMRSMASSSVSEEQRGLMLVQLEAMQAYSSTLGRRLEVGD